MSALKMQGESSTKPAAPNGLLSSASGACGGQGTPKAYAGHRQDGTFPHGHPPEPTSHHACRQKALSRLLSCFSDASRWAPTAAVKCPSSINADLVPSLLFILHSPYTASPINSPPHFSHTFTHLALIWHTQSIRLHIDTAFYGSSAYSVLHLLPQSS